MMDVQDNLSVAFDALREAEALSRLMQISFEYFAEEASDSKQIQEFLDLGCSIAVIRERLDLVQTKIDLAQGELRNRWRG
ncbi:hypothetical protein PDO_4475 [Rhizobium sp. PDO1-076]|uniref:hypothetical protein n=1 Tax=Rhizobium sp. PDO1-076 TaxID=1125979 RepID=UPI00024E2CA6|nr:hypothetical protein [Rhizobium sp. PDO1-076]EHS53013.1 hypothetical protein PDO_4475 [Rhizobium sp. PDO1-076]